MKSPPSLLPELNVRTTWRDGERGREKGEREKDTGRRREEDGEREKEQGEGERKERGKKKEELLHLLTTDLNTFTAQLVSN